MRNNKGFTLIELLTVIVVLLLITLVAIPNIASTFERNKKKINDEKIEVIKSAGAIYASLYLKEDPTEYSNFLNGSCGISIKKLLEKDLLTDDELNDSEGKPLYDDKENTLVIYNKADGIYDIGTTLIYKCE